MEERKIQLKDGMLLVIKKVKVKMVKITKPFHHVKNKVLYNLTVEDDNSFILNSIITHNTGERGLRGWRVWFDEKKPQFTVPIVPLKAKAMHFVNERGEDVFLKKSKGQRPQSWLRRAFYDHRNDVTTIWKKEFSDSNMKKLLKLEKI